MRIARARLAAGLLAVAGLGQAPNPPDPASAAVAAASRLRGTEDELARAARRIDEITDDRQRLRARLDADAARLTPLLPLMQRLSEYPAEALLAAPGSTEDAIRGLLLLRGVTRRLGADAAALAEEQSRLEATGAAMEAELAALRRATEEQRGQAAALDALAAQARVASEAAQPVPDPQSRRRTEAAARAPTLREAVVALAPPKPGARPAPVPGAAWVSPAAGTLVGRFGAATDAGRATGVTLATPSAARVVAPCAGTAVFAQSFRSYGPMTILDCGGARHVVLAGLDRLDIRAGQALQAGQPVGVMPRHDAQAADRSRLYIELRLAGQAVDPAPVLRGGG